MRFSSWAFEIQYLLGNTPWDTEQTPPEVVEVIKAGNLPPGRALDLGCGSGTNCIYLAHHGWRVVGVDCSAVAVCRARRKARRANVTCQFFKSDVTDLSFLRSPFDFVLDIGCLHAIPPHRRPAYAAQVARLTRPDSRYMLYAFARRPDGAGPNGLSPQEVRELFLPDFCIERQEGGDDPTGPAAIWYWLRKSH